METREEQLRKAIIDSLNGLDARHLERVKNIVDDIVAHAAIPLKVREKAPTPEEYLNLLKDAEQYLREHAAATVRRRAASKAVRVALKGLETDEDE